MDVVQQVSEVRTLIPDFGQRVTTVAPLKTSQFKNGKQRGNWVFCGKRLNLRPQWESNSLTAFFDRTGPPSLRNFNFVLGDYLLWFLAYTV